MSNDKAGTIVVGIDGSTQSIVAVKWAERYAKASGASLQLVIAWQHAMAYGQPMMFEGYHPESDAQAVADKAKADLSLPADRVETRTAEGSAGVVLVEASAGALALVVGSRGHSGVDSLLLGSVSSYCVHHANCPVVIVR